MKRYRERPHCAHDPSLTSWRGKKKPSMFLYSPLFLFSCLCTSPGLVMILVSLIEGLWESNRSFCCRGDRGILLLSLREQMKRRALIHSHLHSVRTKRKPQRSPPPPFQLCHPNGVWIENIFKQASWIGTKRSELFQSCQLSINPLIMRHLKDYRARVYLLCSALQLEKHKSFVV